VIVRMPATRKRLLSLGIGALLFALWQIDPPVLGQLTKQVLPAVVAGAAERAAGDCSGIPSGTECVLARLGVRGERPARIILRAPDDRVLTGGWGYLAGTPLPGAGDDTVFRIHARAGGPSLQKLRRGDTLIVELPDAREFVYRVTGARVAERRAIRLDGGAHGTSGLTLLARHPGKAGSDLWFVIDATLLPEPLLAFALPPAGSSPFFEQT
jgi:hypothetical protein